MRITIMTAVAVVTASFGVGPLHAQNLRNVQAPAEFPPASFKGNQYVDSTGCVYIRAGIDGNVTWVPRVNRQRKLICGQTPTQIAGNPAPAAPTVKPPQQITIDAPVATAPKTNTTAAPQVAATPAPKPTPTPAVSKPKVVAAAPSPAPAPTVFSTAKDTAPDTQKTATVTPQTTPQRRTVAAPSPAPAPTVFKTANDAASDSPSTAIATPRKTTPQRRIVAAPSPAPAPTVFKTANDAAASVKKTGVVTTHQSACPNATTVSQRYINSGESLPVRCSPQAINSAPRAAATGDQVLRQDVARVPEGYRPAWDDDRLNPRRAEQTPQGIASMDMIWTKTVPRRLIDQSTGRDVTASVPLVYPYTDVETQERDLGNVTIVHRDGQVVKRVVRNYGAAPLQPTVSTRSAPATATKPKAVTKGQYVQVGMFGVPSNADAAAQKLARTGLPTRMGRLKHGSKSYKLVLAGPFGTSAETQQALGQARSAGFSDAFIR